LIDAEEDDDDDDDFEDTNEEDMEKIVRWAWLWRVYCRSAIPTGEGTSGKTRISREHSQSFPVKRRCIIFGGKGDKYTEKGRKPCSVCDIYIYSQLSYA